MQFIKCDICNNLIPKSSVCPICKSELSVNIDENTEWVTVKVLNDLIYAEMLCANLNRADIPAEILNQTDSTRNFTFGLLTKVNILVPAPYFDEAKNVIEQIESGALSNE